jgi:hypothetical protein
VQIPEDFFLIRSFGAGAGGAALTSAPHHWQYLPESSVFLPHFEQNITLSPALRKTLSILFLNVSNGFYVSGGLPTRSTLNQPAEATGRCSLIKKPILAGIISKKSEIMKAIPVIVIIVACIILLLCSGCLGRQSAQSPVTQVITTQATPPAFETSPTATRTVQTATTIPVTAQQTVVDNLPQEVTILPPDYAIDIGIDKDRVYNTITVTFTGGRGQVLVKNILVRVTTPDGVVEQKNFPIGNQVSIGSSVDLKGTHGSDRVEVFATLGGITYKVKDENMTYAYY